MGIMSKWAGGNKMENHYGGHSMETASVLNGATDAVTPTSKINWSVAVPTVVRTPQPATLQQADEAERQAALFQEAVTNGLRVLKAETKKQQDNARLVKGHRQYLGHTAQAHMEIAGANRGLAGKLHGLREQYAQMGHSLDRKEETVNQKIDLIAAKYKGVS